MEREEAIQVVRGLTETTYFDDRELEGLRTLIPELTESEDERTRKNLIDTIHHAASSSVHISEELEQRYLAYLEKQKPVGGLSKRKVYGIMSKLSNLSQSELIPLDSEEFEVINEITTDVRSLLDYPIEQKPAGWSEELAILEGYIISGDWSDAHKERALDILKSLRPSWKPSKEQMEAIKHAYNSFPDYCPTKLGLKSLYEQLNKL